MNNIPATTNVNLPVVYPRDGINKFFGELGTVAVLGLPFALANIILNTFRMGINDLVKGYYQRQLTHLNNLAEKSEEDKSEIARISDKINDLVNSRKMYRDGFDTGINQLPFLGNITAYYDRKNLQNQIARNEDTINQLRETIRQDGDVKANDAALAAARRALALSETQRHSIEQQLLAKTQEHQNTHVEKTTALHQLQTLRGDHLRIGAELTAHKDEVILKGHLVRQLQNDINGHNTLRTQLEQELGTLRNEYQRLKEDHDKLDGEADDLASEVEEKKNEIKEKEENLKALGAELQKTGAQGLWDKFFKKDPVKEQLKKDIAVIQKEIIALKKAEAKEKKELDDVKKADADMKKKLDICEKQIVKFTDDLTKAKAAADAEIQKRLDAKKTVTEDDKKKIHETHWSKIHLNLEQAKTNKENCSVNILSLATKIGDQQIKFDNAARLVISKEEAKKNLEKPQAPK